MKTRIVAALTGAALAATTFAGLAAAAPDREPDPVEERYREVICRVLEQFDLLDAPELADLVEQLGCEESDDPSSSTSPTSSTTPSSSTPAAPGARTGSGGR
ncbi:hypothetical protein [Saccharothrix hoggarensis]|uniref:Uncharacterized protein n=1 Tax=Saccharothrix hoggarensis TaxID=913853 RepID=A0ABW3QSP4_9PSEU